MPFLSGHLLLPIESLSLVAHGDSLTFVHNVLSLFVLLDYGPFEARDDAFPLVPKLVKVSVSS